MTANTAGRNWAGPKPVLSTQVMAHDRYFSDPASGKYTVNRQFKQFLSATHYKSEDVAGDGQGGNHWFQVCKG